MTSVLRVGVLGLGRIGRIHARNLAHHVPGAVLAACADVSLETMTTVADEVGVARRFTDYRELLGQPDIDAVVVATPTASHFDVLHAAIAAGKQIFAEKPIDLDLDRIDDINAAVERAGISMMVGFQRRYDPDFARLRTMVGEGAVGDVHVVRITSRDAVPPHEAFIPTSGGIFLDMTVHDLDMVRFVTGREVTGVFAAGSVLVDPMFSKYGDWDTVAVTLMLEGGALACIDNSRRAVYGQDQRVEVFGSLGMAAATNHSVDRIVSANAAGAHAARLMDFFPERYADAYRLEMRAFVDAVRAGRPMPVTGADGRRATALGIAARQSAAEQRYISVS